MLRKAAVNRDLTMNLEVAQIATVGQTLEAIATQALILGARVEVMMNLDLVQTATVAVDLAQSHHNLRRRRRRRRRSKTSRRKKYSNTSLLHISS